MATDLQRDPRRSPGSEADMRPRVAPPSSGVPLWVIVAALAALGLLLFVVLDSRRRNATAPPVKARYDDGGALPHDDAPLVMPPIPTPTPVASPAAEPAMGPLPKPPRFIPPPPPAPSIVYIPPPAPQAPPAQLPPRGTNESPLLFDAGGDRAAASATGEGSGGTPGETGPAPAAAANAGVMRHLATTVAQGTLIPGVLESALDSTRAGPVRALVTRDVRGFDGTRVLVPRGSRLFGEYRADLQPGQNRALISWTRLIRPDGATIALASPASDPLGRAGIKGKVNSHFLQRFSAAILQTTLAVGGNYASRLGNGNSAIVVALPGAGQTLAQPLTDGAQIKPTLRVRQGTAIDVFVARDLDFSAVETTR